MRQCMRHGRLDSRNRVGRVELTDRGGTTGSAKACQLMEHGVASFRQLLRFLVSALFPARGGRCEPGCCGWGTILSPGLYAVGGSVKPPFASSVPEREVFLSAAALEGSFSDIPWSCSPHPIASVCTQCAQREPGVDNCCCVIKLRTRRQCNSQGSTPLVSHELTSLRWQYSVLAVELHTTAE